MSDSEEEESHPNVAHTGSAKVSKGAISKSKQTLRQNPDWCSCGHCIIFGECDLCCQKVKEIKQQVDAEPDVTCLTQHSDFKNLCLKEVYLFVFGNGDEQRKTELTNDDYRHTARRNLVKWIWGQTVSNKKLPCCVLDTIWKKFPSLSMSKSDWLMDGIGTMVIINNEDYWEESERFGSQHDVKRLQNLASNLKLQCHVIENKGYDGIETRLNLACKNVLDSDVCFICVILSHGEDNHRLLDAEGNEFNLRSIIKTVTKEIKNKEVVKLFFVQACRGKSVVIKNEDVLHIEDPGEENCLITYCSVYGHAGIGYVYTGSPFIDELCKSFDESHDGELMGILTTMKLNIEKHETKQDPSKPIIRLLASTTTRLTKTVHLQSKACKNTIPPEAYGMFAKTNGLFLIVGDQNKFTEDIFAIKQIAKLWGFGENNIKTPCLELREEARRTNVKMKKMDLLNKIKDYVKNFSGISCFVCAVVSDQNDKGKFKLNYEDDTYDLAEITTLFRGSYLQNQRNEADVGIPAEILRGKPKLFFVQKFLCLVTSDAVGSNADEYLPRHPDADVMITFSQAGSKDKTKENGISAFYDSLLECVTNDRHPQHYDLFQILTKVRNKMSEENHRIPWTQTQLRKQVCFDKPYPV